MLFTKWEPGASAPLFVAHPRQSLRPFLSDANKSLLRLKKVVLAFKKMKSLGEREREQQVFSLFFLITLIMWHQTGA